MQWDQVLETGGVLVGGEIEVDIDIELELVGEPKEAEALEKSR